MTKDIKKILIIVSNCSHLRDLNKTETGVWLEEFAVPYYSFKEAGFEVTVASPLGGEAPVDEKSLLCENPTEWDYTIKYLNNTQKLDEIDYTTFDGIFFPGGHGPMFDLYESEKVAKIVSYFYNKHKPIGAVCHGPAALLKAKTEDGFSIVKDMQVTSFTNEEEKINKMEEIVPFRLETELKKEGALFNAGAPFKENVIVDENLITGQNPASSKKIAEAFIKKFKTD